MLSTSKCACSHAVNPVNQPLAESSSCHLFCVKGNIDDIPITATLTTSEPNGRDGMIEVKISISNHESKDGMWSGSLSNW